MDPGAVCEVCTSSQHRALHFFASPPQLMGEQGPRPARAPAPAAGPDHWVEVT